MFGQEDPWKFEGKQSAEQCIHDAQNSKPIPSKQAHGCWWAAMGPFRRT